MSDISAQLGLTGRNQVIDMPVVGGSWQPVELAHGERPVPPEPEISAEERSAHFGADLNDPYWQVDVAWREWRETGEEWAAQALRAEAQDDPGAAQRLMRLATREGVQNMCSYFLSSNGSIVPERDIQLSEPVGGGLPGYHVSKELRDRVLYGYNPADHDVPAETPALTPVYESTERAASREAFLAEFERQNPYARSRGEDLQHSSHRKFEMTGQRRQSGHTWADGSPVMGTDGRPIHTGELNSHLDEEFIYRGDPRLTNAEAAVKAERRRNLMD